METNNIKKDEVAYDELVVTDSSGSLITGLTNSDFTKDLYNPSGVEVSGTIPVTVTELGTGKYRTSFTPDALGNWVITIYNSSYFTYGKSANYVCVDNLNDDLPGATWDVNLNEHVSSSRSTGYRIKHISAASTTKIINNEIWTKEEKDRLLENLSNVFAELILMKNTQEQSPINQSIDEVTKTVLDVKGILNELKSLDKFKDIKELMESNTLDTSEINSKLNFQIDELKDNFNTLVDNVKSLSENQEWVKSMCTKEDIDTLSNKIIELGEDKNKIEPLLSEIYAYLEELTSLFVKTMSTEKLESVVMEEENEKSN